MPSRARKTSESQAGQRNDERDRENQFNGDDTDNLQARWLNLDENFYNSYLSATSENEEWSLILERTPIVFGEDNSRSSILVEFLFHNLRYCRSTTFSFFQAKTIMGIVQRIFYSVIIQNPRSAYDEAITMFKSEIHKICTEENKFVFSIEIIKSFTIFFSKFFFRNFKLYQTVFQLCQDEIITERTIPIQTPLVPMPLIEGKIMGAEEPVVDEIIEDS
mmetsp:Transcript_3855/g.3951  ORF Transcript_3855/g.3951 Transcript_3855/m.3951 type:complete len:219 (+) Transcript_3855:167-823(+)